jgi:ankyrin repeat protein
MCLLLKWCLEKSSLNCLEFLAAQGYKLDSTNGSDKNTALHIAAKKNDLKLVEALIKLGARADVLNGNGQTTWSMTSDPLIAARLNSSN